MDPLTEQSQATASQPTPTPRNFDFPTLNGDGSVSDLIETRPPPGQRTPPAALSTLALKMDNTPNSLDDGQYDMVDDALSNDGETASIASTTDDFEDDIDDSVQLTPDESGSIADEDEPRPSSEPSTMLSSIRLNKARLQYEAAQKQERQRKEEAMDSFLSEDLETPRQSTINRFPLQPPETVSTEHMSPPSTKSGVEKSTTSERTPMAKMLDVLQPALTASMFLMTIGLLSLTYLWLLTTIQANAVNNVSARREALSTSIVEWTNYTETPKFNIELLIPEPVDSHSAERKTQAMPDVHFQGAGRHYIVVSLPSFGRRFPQAQSITVLRGDTPIDFTQKKLIDGVYGIAIDPPEAFGIFTVRMSCAKPQLNVTVSHNFNRRYHQFLRAQKELSETVSKDVAVARKRAKGLTDIIQLELSASVVATRNVTTQLALQLSRDLQVFANTAASVFGKAALASNHTAQNIRKDMQLARKDLAKARADAQELMVTVKNELKQNFQAAVTEPLLLSRERALMLKDKLFGREKKTDALRKRSCGCSKEAKMCQRGCTKLCKAAKELDREKPTPSNKFKELKPGRRYNKHAKQAPRALV